MQTHTHATTSPPAAPGSVSELVEFLQEFDTAMLTTRTPEGLFRARPMAIQKPAPGLNCDFWFVTSLETGKVGEIAHEHRVGVTCHRPGDRAYVSISALARVRRDPETTRRLFQPDWRIWFPKGPDDDSIALIELEVERAEYWEPRGGSVRVLYEMVKSLVRGEPAGANLPPVKAI